MDRQAELNTFLVGVFNDILRLEERSLAKGPYKNLSVSEMHLLDAAYSAPADPPLTMATLAGKVGVSAGSLTVAVKALEQKGYLQRQRSDADKRRVFVCLTDIARGACLAHQQFHQQMIAGIAETLSDTQLDAFAAALGVLDRYFKAL